VYHVGGGPPGHNTRESIRDLTMSNPKPGARLDL
jgi:hypothetical protein